MDYILQRHPHVDDPVYNQRRRKIRLLVKQYHKDPTVLPLVNYTDEENEIWRTILKTLRPLHRKYASKIYLEGWKKLCFPADVIPELRAVSESLEKVCGFKLIPIEGFVDSKSFLSCLRTHSMFCTQYVRHPSKPLFSDEPDIIHELLGHTPMFTNRHMVEIYELIGKLAYRADAQRLIEIERLAWFTMEAGLIEEEGEIKVLGTAILSSVGELKYSVSNKVRKRPFVMEEVVNTSFDPYVMQDKLFFIRSIAALRKEIKQYFKFELTPPKKLDGLSTRELPPLA
jgi:phenylalanine-4-hydroxylase